MGTNIVEKWCSAIVLFISYVRILHCDTALSIGMEAQFVENWVSGFLKTKNPYVKTGFFAIKIKQPKIRILFCDDEVCVAKRKSFIKCIASLPQPPQ